ncbi:hypothetical protein J4230_02600 [Candidatus Woesearchaeota archaeon]|nr:hypothetical protein [Candidatus Woesearchaeota archaeon]
MHEHKQLWSYWNNVNELINEEIYSIPKEKKAKIIEEWENGIATQNKVTEDQILENIKTIPKIEINPTEWTMDRLKECIDNYVKNRFLSSIALAGMINEYISIYLLDDYTKTNDGLFSITEYFDQLKGQQNRIETLRKLDIITESEKTNLKNLNDIRNKYVHVTQIKYENIREDCLKAIKILIEFLDNRKISTI